MSLNGELIESLPVDNTSYSKSQLDIANLLFKENESTMNAVANELKDAITISILFLLFTSNQADELVRKIIPAANASHVILLGVKCIAIVILFYLIKNFHLSRKP